VTSTNACYTQEVTMKHNAIRNVALLAALLISGAANAATYHYTDHWDYIRKPALSDAEFDSQLQADASTCDGMVGPASGMPTPAYRRCMLQHGWKFLSVTRDRVDEPADPNFSSNARLAPGHYIDHDTGMDCQNMGGAAVCSPPNGTVRYYDPDQGLNCTRSGLVCM
jgi:hypothetical protein